MRPTQQQNIFFLNHTHGVHLGAVRVDDVEAVVAGEGDPLDPHHLLHVGHAPSADHRHEDVRKKGQPLQHLSGCDQEEVLGKDNRPRKMEACRRYKERWLANLMIGTVLSCFCSSLPRFRISNNWRLLTNANKSFWITIKPFKKQTFDFKCYLLSRSKPY